MTSDTICLKKEDHSLNLTTVFGPWYSVQSSTDSPFKFVVYGDIGFWVAGHYILQFGLIGNIHLGKQGKFIFIAYFTQVFYIMH